MDRKSAATTELPWAHPMGWRSATIFGTIFGSGVGGVPWLILTVATLHRGWWRYDVIPILLFAMGFSIPLLMEWDSLDRIRRGKARDIREAPSVPAEHPAARRRRGA